MKTMKKKVIFFFLVLFLSFSVVAQSDEAIQPDDFTKQPDDPKLTDLEPGFLAETNLEPIYLSNITGLEPGVINLEPIYLSNNMLTDLEPGFLADQIIWFLSDEPPKFWLIRAIHQGYTQVQFMMGTFFAQAKIHLSNKAKTLLRRAGNKGHRIAQLQLGFIFLNEGKIALGKAYLKAAVIGKILWVRFDGNMEQTKNWLEEEANQGDAEAQFKLGFIFLDEGNIDQAQIWLEEAANQKHVAAQFLLRKIVSPDWMRFFLSPEISH